MPSGSVGADHQVSVASKRHEKANNGGESDNIWLFQSQYGCIDLIGGKLKKAYRAKKEPANMLKYLKWLLSATLILLALFSLYTIWLWGNENPSIRSLFKSHQIKQLKMVNVLCRHGDRAPSDKILQVDPHGDHPELFWPNGLNNMTDFGKLREFRVGLQLRKMYKDYLSFNSSDILAFSSPIGRCMETTKMILQGLYDLEWTKAEGRHFAELGRRCFRCLSTGSGFPDEWKQVNIDTKTIPTLSFYFLDNCKFRIEHPAAIDKDLLINPEIRSLEGVEKLKDIIKQRYNLDFNYTVSGLWSTTSCEMNLYRTQATFNYTNHYNDWVNLEASRRGDSVITMMDLLEQVSTLLYRDRLAGTPTYIQNSPIVTSIIESQLMALGQKPTNERMKIYENKKLILLSSHDSILQNLLNELDIIHMERSVEDTFHELRKRKQSIESSKGKLEDDIDEQAFLSGIRMSSFGMSIRFELWEYTLPEDLLAGAPSANAFPAVQASIYNKEEAKYHDIQYKPVKLGQVCRRKFRSKYPKASEKELATFYPTEYDIDWSLSCPFKLFKNVTASLMLDEKRIDQLCNWNRPS